MKENNVGSVDDVKQVQDTEGAGVNLGRHKAQCSICLHPECKEVEQCWIDWEHISHIEYVYHISRDAMYRHAHALRLASSFGPFRRFNLAHPKLLILR